MLRYKTVSKKQTSCSRIKNSLERRACLLCRTGDKNWIMHKIFIFYGQATYGLVKAQEAKVLNKRRKNLFYDVRLSQISCNSYGKSDTTD